MTRVAWSVLVAGVLVGCTQAADISDNTCGNGVLDPGEDRDRPDDPATCSADCRILCKNIAGPDGTCDGSDDLTGVCCPIGFTCGGDSTCHAPSGTFAVADVSEPFDTLEFTVADIDRDGIDDIMGVSSSAVITRYGSTTTPLATFDTEIAPFSNGGAAFGDLNGDTVPDLVIPTLGGLFTFETTTGVPLPVAYPVTTTTGTVHLRMAPAPAGIYGSTVLLDQIGAGTAATFALSVTDTNTVPAHPPCGVTTPPLIAAASDIQGRSLYPYLDGAGTNAQLRTPILIANEGLYRSAPTHAPFPSGVSQVIPSPPIGGGGGIKAAATAGETFFVNLDGSTVCPDLVFPFVDVATGQEMTGVLPGSGATDACTVSTTVLKGAFAIPGVPLTAVTLQTLGHPIGLVMSTGVYTVKLSTKAATLVTAASRVWRYAITADVNGDAAWMTSSPPAATPTSAER